MFAYPLEASNKFLKRQQSVAVEVLAVTIDQTLYIWIVVQFELGGADTYAPYLKETVFV